MGYVITEGLTFQLLDRFNDNKPVNDMTVTAFNSDTTLPEITQYFAMKNNTTSVVKRAIHFISIVIELIVID
jgi:hypothetical protein